MAFDVSNFIIDRVLRGVMTSTADGSVMYSINQIENPSLKCSADEKTAVDALGTTIQSYYKSKNCEFSAENSMFDLGLFATQQGTSKRIATAASKIITPAMETIDVTGTTCVLKNTPTAPLTAIYELKGDSTMGKKYTSNATATVDKFAYDEASKTITLPTSVTVGSQVFVMYEYATENAVEVVGSATQFPKAGKFVMEVLGNDVCDPTTLIYAYVIFPNAKLDPNSDIQFTTDGKHPFSMKCQQSYCDKQKTLFKIVIPQM
ncbi:MAG: hypothetical protein RSD74_01055 [Angelakisella sp.]